MKQRFTVGRERDRATVRVPSSRTNFGDSPAAADDWNVVTHGTARAVERWTETFLRGLHLEKIVQAKPELFEIGRRDAGQRIAQFGGLCLEHAGAIGKRGE